MIRHRLAVFVLPLVLAATLLPGPASARKGGTPQEAPNAAMEQIRALHEEIAARELYAALALTAEQRTTLAAIIVDVEAERAAHRAERAQNAPVLQAVLTDYLAELKKNGAPNETTVARLVALREGKRGDREGKREERQDRREQLRALLTGAQTEALREFRPMRGALPDEEEMEQRQEERRERRADREGRDDRNDHGEREDRGDHGERGGDLEDHGREGRAHGQLRRTVDRVLLNPSMLALLG